MRKQVYSDGKSRNLNLGFEIPLNNDVKITGPDGLDIPFILAKRNKIRFTKSIPTGDVFIDLEESKPAIKPFSLDTIGFSFIQKKDLEKLNVMAQQIGINEKIISQKEIDIKSLAEAIKLLETNNAQRIDENWMSIQKSLQELYDTITGLNDQGKTKSSYLETLIMQIATASEIALKSHLEAKNPHNITKKTIGLDKVDNTSDLDKPISDAVRKALELKVDIDELDKIYSKIDEESQKNEKYRELNVWGGAGTGSGSAEVSNVIFRSW